LLSIKGALTRNSKSKKEIKGRKAKNLINEGIS
jgi:hypothetical protein